MKRNGIKYNNPENYFPIVVRGGESSKDRFIADEVTKFYENRYGSEVFGKNIGNERVGRRVGGMTKTADATAVGTGFGAGSANNINVTVPQPYIPEFASPDRLFFPSDPKQAMKFWRYFYALDPVCGNVIDMYAEMIMSDAELTGEGVEGEIRDTYYDALEETNALGQFRWFIVGYMVDGEVVPHLIWSDAKGRWSYLGFQDPINLKVVDVPFIGTQPYLELQVSEQVRKILNDPDPRYNRFRDNMPPEFLHMIREGRGIPLDTEDNVSFVARRLSPYDIRGISIFSRLWRILTFEDSVFNCHAKGSLITMNDYSQKKIEDIKVGDRVIDKDGNEQTVEAQWSEGVKEVIKITFGENATLICTPNHAFPLYKRSNTSNRTEYRCEAGDVALSSIFKVICGGSEDYLQPVEISKSPDVEVYNLAVSGSHSYLVNHVATYNCSIQTARRHACFVAGTKVLTEDGVKEIEKISTGDRVLSGDGNFKKVLAAWEDHADEIVRISCYDSEELECTTNHRFPVWSDQINVPSGHESLQTMEAKDIKPGDCLLVPRKFEPLVLEVNDKNRALARLLGYYTAGGSILPINEETFKMTFHYEKSEFSTWIRELNEMGHSLGLSMGILIRESPKEPNIWNDHYVDVMSIEDQWVIDYCSNNVGTESRDKSFSEDVMRWPLELKEELLRGLYMGDGHRSEDGETADCTCVSSSLAYQVRLILAQLGVYGSICKSDMHSKNPELADCYTVTSTGMGGRKIRNLVWGEKLPEQDGRSRGCWTWMDDDYIYVPVKDVEIVRRSTKVYNMTVEGDHSYIAAGLKTFNSPLKVVKLGDPSRDWIPGPEHERRVRDLLAIAETDPHAWLIYNYAVNFEAWGTTDRIMGIKGEWDIIERIKLIALGVSRAFLTGEVTYASAEKGLQVFLERLNGMRTFFENQWWYPRFFGVMAKRNGWIKPTQAELRHGVRTRRSARELIENDRYIIPKLEWSKSLSSQSKMEKVRILMDVKARLGIDVSRAEVMANLGLNWEEQAVKVREENDKLKQINKSFGITEQPKQPPTGQGGEGFSPDLSLGDLSGGPGGMEAPPEGAMSDETLQFPNEVTPDIEEV